MIGIILLIISTGIFIRGLLFYIASKYPINSKFKTFSISKSENALEYTEENSFASKAYIFMGIVVFLFTLILLFTFKEFMFKYWIMYIMAIFLIDLLTNILVNIKIGLNKYDKAQKKEED